MDFNGRLKKIEEDKIIIYSDETDIIIKGIT